MSVTVLEVMAAARTRAASLVAEVAGYLVLALADQVVGAPRVLAPADVALGDDGVLRLIGGKAAAEAEAESALRELLAELLGVSASITPPILRASQRRAGAVSALVRELEAALIPVNRGAARRALSRLYRDVERARDAGRLRMPSEPPAAVALPPPPPVEEEPSLADALVAPPLPAVSAEESPSFVVDEAEMVLTPEPSPGPAVGKEPATAPEPVVSRRLMEPSVLSPMVPSPIVVWDVPDLDVPIEVVDTPPIIEPAETDPPLELAGCDATDRAPTVLPDFTEPLPAVAERSEPEPEAECAPELTAPLFPPLPKPPPRERPKLELASPLADDEAPWDDSSDYTPGLRNLVTVARALVPSSEGEPDPDDFVIERERTEPLPPVATPSPLAWTLAEYDELVAIKPQPALPALAFEAAEPGFEPVVASPIAAMPVVALEKLVPAPERPRVHVPAPSRYEPRRSDVESLVDSFGVRARSEPRVCEDLKRVAGLDRTQAPPHVSTRTPPPVEVGSEADETPRALARRSRIGLGVLALALVASGAGAVSSAVSSAPDALVAAAAVPEANEPQAPSCSATLAVIDIPSGARALVRQADRRARVPSYVDGNEAVFRDLRCSQPVEVTVASDADGARSWVRIPVSADAMSPSAEAPSEVRIAVSVK